MIFWYKRKSKFPINFFVRSPREKREERYSPLDVYRAPPVIINSRHIPPKKRSQNSLDFPEYAIPMKKIERSEFSTHAQKGVDNFGYKEQEESDDLYRQQLERFLNDAPNLTMNGVATESEPASTRDDEQTFNVSNTEDEGDYQSLKEEHESNQASMSFTPALKKQEDIQNKIVDRGPSRFRLVMTP